MINDWSITDTSEKDDSKVEESKLITMILGPPISLAIPSWNDESSWQKLLHLFPDVREVYQTFSFALK